MPVDGGGGRAPLCPPPVITLLQTGDCNIVRQRFSLVFVAAAEAEEVSDSVQQAARQESGED